MTKKSKAEQVEKKVQDTAPAAQQAEQMESADAARQPSEEELKAMLRGENRQHDEALGDAWAVLLGQNPMTVMPQVVGTVLHGKHPPLEPGGRRQRGREHDRGQEPHVVL